MHGPGTPPAEPAPVDANRRRIELTVSCRDCDTLPKVAGAGRVADGVQVMHNGVRVVAGGYHGEWMQEIIERLEGHHEPQEELAFHAVVERLAEDTEAPVVVELGAFWAYYALWALHRIPAGRAVLVEPDPANLAMGRRNFELNGRAGVFIQAAAGAEAAPPEPFVCESDGAERSISTESVPSILEKTGLPRVDLLCADVQGAELAVLDGARPTIEAGRLRFAVVSTHHHSISGDPLTHERCLAAIRDAGGHVIAEHTVAESFSGDGLVVASFDRRDRDMEVRPSRARAGESLFGDPLAELRQAWDARDRALGEVATLTERARDEIARLTAELDAAQERNTAEIERLNAELAAVREGAAADVERLTAEAAGLREQIAAMLATKTFRYTAAARRAYARLRRTGEQ